MSASLAAFEPSRLGISTNTVFKSGPLFISSKGIGWKSWKKRWFILTRTSLVFFKSDPSSLPQQGREVNLTLGGIDLNNLGSVVVREDKKLLTVLFSDGHNGRSFTLKAETTEDLYEWKMALDRALAQAPCAALVTSQNGLFQNDTHDSIAGSFLYWRDKHPVKSLVVGRPILLTLEDIDGIPSFLEKALQFLETFGTKVEGILRLSADVEEVERRVQEYEEGKTEFGSDEDAHVVGDCVKCVLRELPSSPVPASCCTALLEAYKIDQKEARVNGMISAILETFPDPNRRLFQRILKMMHTISQHSSENRMTPPAIAVCMAPLLLRPLLAGECDMDDDFDMNSDNSAQLLAAANAANNAQAIITTLLEEYDSIFYRCSIPADSRIEHSESDDSSVNDNLTAKNNGYHDTEKEDDTDDDPERFLNGKLSNGSDIYDYKVQTFVGDDSWANQPYDAKLKSLATPQTFRQSHDEVNDHPKQMKVRKNPTGLLVTPVGPSNESYWSMREILSSTDPGHRLGISGPGSSAESSMPKMTTSTLIKHPSFLGRSVARKTLSMESVDSSGEEELAIKRLELTISDLRLRIAKEARGNAILQASLERRKQALHERHLALKQDVQRLQEQLQVERDLRSAVEVGLSMSSGHFSNSRGMDWKMRAELEEIALAEADAARLKQKVAELHQQLNQQRQHQFGSLSDAYKRRFMQQDFHGMHASYNQEKKHRKGESLMGHGWRNVKAQILAAGGSSMQHSRMHFTEPTGLMDSKSSEASVSMCMNEFCSAVGSGPSTSTVAEVLDFPRHYPAASSTLVELTSRLDYFKQGRSQLMAQFHNLDLSYGTPSSLNFLYRPSSPS